MVDKRLGGDIAGPGGPHDRDAVVFDTTGALIQDYLTVAKLETRSGELAVGMLMEGRIVHTKDRSKVLVLLGADGVAAVISELAALLGRDGMGPELADLLLERIASLRSEGLTEPGPEAGG